MANLHGSSKSFSCQYSQKKIVSLRGLRNTIEKNLKGKVEFG